MLFSQINLPGRKLITRNLTIEENNNHITCTQIFLDKQSLEKPRRENQHSRFVDFILSRRNMEISYKEFQPIQITE